MNKMNPIIHVIESGDTLYKLAMRYGTTVQNIMDTNLALDPYSLRVGQRIFIFTNNRPDMNSCISLNQVRLLTQMNLVWEQHIMWTRMLLISIAENLKDLSATETRLMENPRDIANIFRRYYGNNVADEIQKLITEHLAIGKDLIVSLKNKKEELAEKLNTEWYKNADKIAETFSSINPFYPKEEVRKMFYEHLRLTSNEVNFRLEGMYAEDIKAFDIVQREALKMSEFFVDGIVKQFSRMF